jgi:hypothetical protein
MDERTWEVMVSVKNFLDEAVDFARKNETGEGDRIADVVTEHLGHDAARVPIVRLDVPKHQFVNLDIAVEAVVEQTGGSRLLGVGGGEQRHHQTFGDLLQRQGRWGMPVGPVDRVRVETGPGTSREAVACGIHLFEYAGSPVALFQRQGNPRYDSGTGVELIAAKDVHEPLLSDLRRLMVELSVFRGQVLSFSLTDHLYGPSAGGIAFLDRSCCEMTWCSRMVHCTASSAMWWRPPGIATPCALPVSTSSVGSCSMVRPGQARPTRCDTSSARCQG